jgi:hypothetical protein
MSTVNLHNYAETKVVSSTRTSSASSARSSTRATSSTSRTSSRWPRGARRALRRLDAGAGAEVVIQSARPPTGCARGVVGPRGRQGHEGREDPARATVRKPPQSTRPPSVLEREPTATSASRPRASCAPSGGTAGLHRERLPAERPDAGPLTSPPARRGGGRPPARAGALHRDDHALRDVEGDLRRPRVPPEIAASSRSWRRRRRAQSTPEDERTVLFPSIYMHQERAFREFLVEGRTSSSRPAPAPARPSASSCRCSARSTTRRCARPRPSPARRARADPVPDERAGERPARRACACCSATLPSPTPSRGSGRIAASRASACTPAAPVPRPRSTSRDSERVKPLLEYYLGLSPEVEERLRRLGRYPAKDLQGLLRQNEARRRTYQSRQARRAGVHGPQLGAAPSHGPQ